MPRVGHPWRKHFCDAWYIIMEVDVMIILVMSWNTSTTAHLWLSWSCHKMFMDVHWYVSNVSTFPNTFALVLDSNLHDLNGTNLDWRCFQQNYHGVIYVQEQTFSEWPETSRNVYLEIIKNPCKIWRPVGPHPSHEGGGAPAPPGRAPTSWAPWSSSDLNSNSIYSCSERNKSRRNIHRVLRYGAAAKP